VQNSASEVGATNSVAAIAAVRLATPHTWQARLPTLSNAGNLGDEYRALHDTDIGSSASSICHGAGRKRCFGPGI
jgi:hypothetical protein